MTSAQEITTTALAELDETIASRLHEWHVPGLALAVVKDGETIFTRGYGKRNLTNGDEVTPQTSFALGSGSKAFTAATVAMLVDEGKLNWDTPVQQYIPTFKLYDQFASEHITVRDLLLHNSGLPRHDLSWYRSDYTRKEMIERLRYLEPSKDFRSTWQYQNLMYATAGYLVECISGLSWEAFVEQHIFKPLGMHNSYMNDTDARAGNGNYSLPYHSTGEEIKEIPFYSYWQAMAPAGSIHTCAEDMSKWLLFHLNNGKVGEKQLISEAQMAQLHSPQMSGVDRELTNLTPTLHPELFYSSYAMGWIVTSLRGNVLLHHGGSIDGFHSLTAFLPGKNVGVVALTNTASNMLETVTVHHILDLLLGVEPTDWHNRYLKIYQGLVETMQKVGADAQAERVPDTQPSHALAAYTGTFEHGGYGTTRIELDGEQFTFHFNNMKLPMEHYHYDTFLISFPRTLAKIKVTFTTNARGDIESFAVPFQANVSDIVFKRVASQMLFESSYLTQFTGEYEIVMGEQTIVVSVVLQGEALILNAPNQGNVELEPYKTNEFRAKIAPSQILSFVYNAEGQVSHVRLPGGISATRKA